MVLIYYRATGNLDSEDSTKRSTSLNIPWFIYFTNKKINFIFLIFVSEQACITASHTNAEKLQKVGVNKRSLKNHWSVGVYDRRLNCKSRDFTKNVDIF